MVTWDRKAVAKRMAKRKKKARINIDDMIDYLEAASEDLLKEDLRALLVNYGRTKKLSKKIRNEVLKDVISSRNYRSSAEEFPLAQDAEALSQRLAIIKRDIRKYHEQKSKLLVTYLFALEEVKKSGNPEELRAEYLHEMVRNAADSITPEDYTYIAKKMSEAL